MKQDTDSEVLIKRECPLEVEVKDELIDNDGETYNSVDKSNISNTTEINKVLIKEELILAEFDIKTENEDAETVDVTVDRIGNTKSAVGIEDKIEYKDKKVKEESYNGVENKCESILVDCTDNNTNHNHQEDTCVVKHKEVKDFACALCPKSFASKGSLIKHMYYHTSEKLYECDTCGKSFREKGGLSAHIRMHTGENLFTCRVCKSTFYSKMQLEVHFLHHNKDEPYKCGICHETFGCESSIITSYIQIRSGKEFICDLCGKIFCHKRSLRTHIQTEIRPYECGVCKRKFKTNARLKAHVLVHTDVKPHACGTCHKVFRRKNDMNRHVLIHLDVKPFECNVCKRRFRHRGNMNKHMRVHTGLKTHKCGMCGKRVGSSSELKQHLWNLHRDRPFECGYCKQSFHYELHLERHSKVCALVSEISFKPRGPLKPPKCHTCGVVFSREKAGKAKVLARNNSGVSAQVISADNKCVNRGKSSFDHKTENPFQCVTCSKMSDDHKCINCGKLLRGIWDYRFHSFECSFRTRLVGIPRNSPS